MDTLYANIQNTTMPRRTKQALLDQVVATNHSLQVFFDVSCPFCNTLLLIFVFAHEEFVRNRHLCALVFS